MPRDAGLLKAHDPQHLAFARTTGHVLVTHDADLLRMANRGVPHMGIAYCAPRSRTTSEIVRTLLLIYEVLTPDEMANHIEFL